MFLSWSFYGTEGHARIIENAFDTAQYLYDLLEANENFVLLSKQPLPCLQVCFYWSRKGVLQTDDERNSEVTEKIAKMLIPRGFMIDYAPGERGKFFRVVVGRETRKYTIESLVQAINELGEYITGSG